MRSLPRSAQIYISAVVVLAAVVVAQVAIQPVQWSTVVVLALLFLICESAPAFLASERATVTLSFSAALASVVLVGPVGAAVVGVAAVASARRGLPWVKRLFNGSQDALSAYGAGMVYQYIVGGPVGVLSSADFSRVSTPFLAAVLTYAVINTLLTLVVLRLTRELPPIRGRNSRTFVSAILSFLGYGMFGLLIAALWGALGGFAALLVLLPLFVARWAFTQHAAQQAAHDSTIAALCQAVETKDYYTRGHSERVSKASVLVAREIGMRGARLEALRYAGMLHDVGKLGVPTKVLQKAGALSEEEFAAIQLHPMRGLEIVREIGFLDEALAGIMHHHERMDGRGYPMGLAAGEIPEFARVISVADAFDSMTSTRSYRDARSVAAAIAELQRWSGRQFDSAMVDALVRVVGREGWQPSTVPSPADDAVETAHQDHDDPSAPLRVTDREVT